MRLAEQVRPKRFEDVIGQKDAVSVLLRWSQARTGESVILSGSSGSGKTTLAEIYANALLCQHGTGSPCLQENCQDCADIAEGRHINLRSLVGGDNAEREIANTIAHEPSSSMGGGHLVIVIDHAQRMATQSFDVLRRRLERSEPQVTFIVCTTCSDNLPDKLKALFVELTLGASTLSDREAYLHRLEQKIRVTMPAEVLTFMVDHAGPSLEIIARDVQKLHTLDALTLDGVQRLYRLHETAPVLGFLRAFAAGRPLQEQVAALSLLDASPAERIKKVEAALSMLFHGEVLELALPQGERVRIDEDSRHDLVEKFNAHGSRLGFVPRQFWLSLLALWHPDPSASEWTLRNTIAECQRFLHDPDAHQADLRPKTSKTPRQLGRPRSRAPGPRRGSTTKRNNAYLTRQEVQGLWDAAAFMVQTQGVFFNARMEFYHQALGVKDPQNVGPLMTALMHEMRMQVRRWAKAKPHSFSWAYVHERVGEPGARTRFALHVPDIALGLESYILGRLLRRLCPKHDPSNSLAFKRQGDGLGRLGGDNGVRLGVHLDLLRSLSEGLDPDCRVSAGSLSPLVRDLLRIPKSNLHVLGMLGGGQRCGVSRNIDEKARSRESEQLTVMSAWDHGVLGATEEGFDYQEYEERTKAKAQLARSLALLEGDGPIWTEKRHAYIVKFRNEWNQRAQHRIDNFVDFHN